MIKSFKHKGLEAFHRLGQTKGIHQSYVKRLTVILPLLEAAEVATDTQFPGSQLHQLRGDLAGFWSIKVSGNYRLIFRFEDGNVYDVDIVDYH